MPRGQSGKANRKHKKACASGNSTKGSSTASITQMNGKKYNKKETSSYFGIDIKIVVYEGIEYDIHYKLESNKLTIHSVQKNRKDMNFNTGTDDIRDQELKFKIITKFIQNISIS